MSKVDLSTLEITLGNFVPKIKVRQCKITGKVKVIMSVHGLNREVVETFPEFSMRDSDAAIKNVMERIPTMIINSYGDKINDLEGEKDG